MSRIEPVRVSAMGSKLSFSEVYGQDRLNVSVIFSFVDGFVWLSWPGAASAVRVGGYDDVTEAMRDFLAQCELGERLANGTPTSASSQSS